MGKELGTTVLEERLGAQRTLMAMLMAHLADNGLIDRNVIESDYWALHEYAKLGEHAQNDMIGLFHMVDQMLDGWESQRQ